MAKGKKTGGRQKGTPNKRTQAKIAEMAARVEHLKATGEMPLEYMLRLMRDPNTDPRMRADMAKAAANYCHPKLSTIDHGNKDGGTLVVKIID